MGELAEGGRQATVERVTLDGPGGTPVEAIHARPDGEPAGALVLHPDIGGIRPLFDDLCRRLATHGLEVCAPEPFALVPERDELDLPARLARVAELDDDAQLALLAGAADFLDAPAVAVMGFCMGGMYTFKAAATDRFARAVAFYGMIRVPEEWRAPGQREPLDTAADVCPTLAILGAADHYTPPADVEALRRAWADRHDCEIVVYADAEHGFVHAPDRPTHRPEDARDAWHRALAFLTP